MTQTDMISFKQTHANENNSYNKPFTIRISLKTTQLIKINIIFRETPSSVVIT